MRGMDQQSEKERQGKNGGKADEYSGVLFFMCCYVLRSPLSFEQRPSVRVTSQKSTMEGQNILIVGGTSGIGYDVAERCVQAGATTYIASRNPSDSVTELGASHIEVDVTQDNVADAFKDLPDELHGLVYCPGTITLKPFKGLKEEDWKNDLEVNFMGAVRSINAVLKSLKKSGDASIVLYSTVASQVGMPYHASIASAKSAVEGLGKSLSAELVSDNVRVNMIAPSLTNSPLAGQLLSSEEKKEASKKRHPLGRYGETKDIASLTRFLLSPNGDWITGQVFPVDGGISGVRSV